MSRTECPVWKAMTGPARHIYQVCLDAQSRRSRRHRMDLVAEHLAYSDQMKLRQRLTHWFVERWWIDLPLSFALILGLAQINRAIPGLDIVGHLALTDRQSVYSDLMQLAAFLGAFSGMGSAVYLGLNSRGIQQLNRMVGTRIVRIWIFSLVTPWIGALLVVATEVTDRGNATPTNFAHWIPYAALALISFHLCRVSWLFWNISQLHINEPGPIRAVAHSPIGMKARPF